MERFFKFNRYRTASLDASDLVLHSTDVGNAGSFGTPGRDISGCDIVNLASCGVRISEDVWARGRIWKELLDFLLDGLFMVYAISTALFRVLKGTLQNRAVLNGHNVPSSPVNSALSDHLVPKSPS